MSDNPYAKLLDDELMAVEDYRLLRNMPAIPALETELKRRGFSSGNLPIIDEDFDE